MSTDLRRGRSSFSQVTRDAEAEVETSTRRFLVYAEAPKTRTRSVGTVLVVLDLATEIFGQYQQAKAEQREAMIKEIRDSLKVAPLDSLR